jgi:hypothetical protein
MRNLTITFSMLLIGAAAVPADELLPRIRNAVADRFSPVGIQPGGRPGTFQATLKKIEGDKITLVRHIVRINEKEETPTEKEETLITAADCKLLEARTNKESHTIDMIPLEGGLKGDIDPKDFALAQVTINRDNNITEIRAGGDGWPALSSRYQVIVLKVDGEKIQVKPPRFADTTLPVGPDCKVFETRYVKEGSPLVTAPVANGLKADVFTRETVRALITTDKENRVVEVCLLRPHPHRFEAAIKKIEGDRLTLVKHLSNGSRGNEETLSAAAHCEVFEYRIDKRSQKIEKVPYEPALKCDFLTMKRVELRFHTDREHKVTRINVLHNPYWYEAVVRMDKRDTVRIFKEKKDDFLALAEDCRIFQARVDRETTRTTYSLVKDGIKGAIVPNRPFLALVKQNDEDRVTEMRFHKDPANFVAQITKVTGNQETGSRIGFLELALSGPGSKSKGVYHSELAASKDCRVFKRKSSDGQRSLEAVEQKDDLSYLNARVINPQGKNRFVIARILLGDDGTIKEVQILEGVSSVEQAK